jgi:hypothetical protein
MTANQELAQRGIRTNLHPRREVTQDNSVVEESVAIPSEQKAQQSIFRRGHRIPIPKKLAAGLAAIGVAVTMLGAVKPTQGSPKIESNPTPIGSLVETRTSEQILKEIQTRYGVTIPDKVDPLYSKENPDGTTAPNLVPNPEQAGAIEEALSEIPHPGDLAPLILLYKDNDLPVANGSYLGYIWPSSLHQSGYPNFTYDKMLDNRPAIELDLPDIDLDATLPKKTKDMGLVPELAQPGPGQSENINMTETVPWTTQKERLKQVIVHEYGHAIQDQVSLEQSKLKYPTDSAAALKDYWSKQTLTIVQGNTWDTTNPMYLEFAKVDGWKLVPYSDFIRQFDPAFADYITTRFPQDAANLIWDRDPAVWGDLQHRKNQLTVYASYGPIQETWAEFWMASVLYPELLTDEQRTFFQNIQNGIKQHPNDFFRQAVQNPDSLLK